MKVKRIIKLYKEISNDNGCSHHHPPSFHAHDIYSLTQEEKQEIEKQNAIIEQLIKPLITSGTSYQISRDKKGHPVIMLLETKPNRKNYVYLNLYLLGINAHNGAPILYKANECILKQDKVNQDLYINSLSTHRAFDNLGLGRLALQAAENYALDLDCKTMSITSLKTYILAPNVDPTNKRLMQKESYFDKNYYFYSTHGFVKSGPTDSIYNIGARNLVKYSLQNTLLNYGVCRPVVAYDKRDRKFSMENEETAIPEDLIDDAFITETNVLAGMYPYENRFGFSNNKLSSEQFSPLILEPTRLSTKSISALIDSKIKNKNTHSKFAQLLEKLFWLDDTIDFANKKYNHLLEHLCMDKDFLKKYVTGNHSDILSPIDEEEKGQE